MCHVPVHAPIQPLPVGNYATVHDRYKKWAVIAGAGIGASLQSKLEDQDLLSAIRSANFRLLILTKDALTTNHNIVCMIERDMRLAKEAARSAGRLYFVCFQVVG